MSNTAAVEKEFSAEDKKKIKDQFEKEFFEVPFQLSPLFIEDLVNSLEVLKKILERYEEAMKK